MSIWNQSLDRIKFAAVDPSSMPRGDGDLANQVFFDSRYYGASFGARRWRSRRGGPLTPPQRVEADVVFNSAFKLDSYRGNVRSNGAWDIRRVALHEFGHALGLDHPDEHGQSVIAQMNSKLGNLDSLTADDIAGGQSLYGSGVTADICVPAAQRAECVLQSADRRVSRRAAGRSVADVRRC